MSEKKPPAYLLRIYDIPLGNILLDEGGGLTMFLGFGSPDITTDPAVEVWLDLGHETDSDDLAALGRECRTRGSVS